MTEVPYEKILGSPVCGQKYPWVKLEAITTFIPLSLVQKNFSKFFDEQMEIWREDLTIFDHCLSPTELEMFGVGFPKLRTTLNKYPEIFVMYARDYWVDFLDGVFNIPTKSIDDETWFIHFFSDIIIEDQGLKISAQGYRYAQLPNRI